MRYRVVLESAGPRRLAARYGVFRMLADGEPGEATVETSGGRRTPVTFLMPHTLDAREGFLSDAQGRSCVRVGDDVLLGGGFVPGSPVFAASSVAVRVRDGDE